MQASETITSPFYDTLTLNLIFNILRLHLIKIMYNTQVRTSHWCLCDDTNHAQTTTQLSGLYTRFLHINFKLLLHALKIMNVH